ncbi:transposase [Candidatus Odyssella thessalonicensis]|uniref:transposase n=1 Tax=Candidatus Odyssella thessalonicensis TaxID=84647 RepID=UPI000225B972
MTRSKVEQIEVITSSERRRRWSAFEKKTIVEETYEMGKSVSYVARKHGLSPSQLFLWRRKMEEGAVILPTLKGVKSRIVESCMQQLLPRRYPA